MKIIIVGLFKKLKCYYQTCVSVLFVKSIVNQSIEFIKPKY